MASSIPSITQTDPNYNTTDMTDPQNNMFALGGNIINSQTGNVTPVAPTVRTLNGVTLSPSVTTPSGLSAVSPGTPPPDVSNLPTSYSLTKPEQNAEDLTSQLEALNNKLVGKSAATTKAQQDAGLPALQSQQNDLSAQLAALKSQAAAIPSQYQNFAAGRGITAGGLQPLQAAATRNNAVQALSISAMLDATNGLIASANQKVSDAIDAQFGPIQDQITALTNNLKLVQESPDYTEAEKAQAAQQQQIAAQAQAKLDQQKTDQANIYNVALEAAKNGTDAATLQNIMNADSPMAAMQAAGASLQTAAGTQIVDANGHQLLINKETGATIADLGLSSSGMGASGGQSFTGLPSVSMTTNNTPNMAQQQQFLSSIQDPNLQTLIKGLANYTINPASVPTRNYRGVGGITQAQAIELAQQYDPTYDSKQYASRQAVMKEFTSGKYSQNINSLNTAVGHISDILSNFSGLNNTGFTPYNQAKNAVAKLFGSGAIGKASLNINAATGELASVFKSAGATDSEIKNLGTIDANSSPDQVNSYIETATQLLASRLQALQDTYTQGMGKAPDNSFLSLTAQQQLLNLQQQGLNIQVPELANSPLVKLQTFHDADPNNASLIDQLVKADPSLANDPQKMIDTLAQNGITL